LRALGTLLRVFAYIFHVLLSLAALAVGGVTLLSGGGNLSLGMLPWKGDSLANWLVALGLVGLLGVFLAVSGRFRLMLTLWALFVLVMLVRGVFFASGVSFDGPSEFRTALWMIFAALLAFVGSLTRPLKPLR
jgi:hypothetical protein